MFLKRVHIKHYRSIEEVEFYVNRFTTFVGPNNAGKSNIISAITHVLGDTYPSRKSFQDTDFFQFDQTKPIFIEVDVEIEGKTNRFTLEVPSDSNSRTSFTHVDGDGVENRYVKEEVRGQCPVVYLDANRNLEYHLGSSRWTLFGRVIRALHRDFVENGGEEKQNELSKAFGQTLGVLKTDAYTAFEASFTEGFAQQLRHTTHTLKLEFRTFDPQSFYSNVRPIILDDLAEKSAEFLGQGMRNMILLSLFRSYAKVFRGDAILALDEPELFLHPQAQRSLATLFRQIVDDGNQILISTHSPSFLSLDRFDEVVLVAKKGPPERRVTTVRQLLPTELKTLRQQLHPDIKMSLPSLRERVALICGRPQSEALFSHAVVLVEGPSEELTLPIYAKACGLDLDAASVSVVNAGGKTNLDILYHIFVGFEIPTYVIFDNDRGSKEANNPALNRMLLRMLDQTEEDMPDGCVTESFAISDKDFEDAIRKSLETDHAGLYEKLIGEAGEVLGSTGKPLRAKFIAERLATMGIVPSCVAEIVAKLATLAGVASANASDGEGFDS